MLVKWRFFNILFTCFILEFTILNVYGKTIEIRGLENAEIISLIKTNVYASVRQKNVATDSISMALIMENDIKSVKTILASFGYFDAEVSMSRNGDMVILDIDLKDRYVFSDILLTYKDYPEYSSGVTVGEVFDLIGIPKDSYTSTKEIADACVKLKNFYHRHGFAFVEISTPSIKLDKNNKKIKVVFNITLNKQIIIDKTIVIVKSNDRTHQLLKNFVLNRVEWQEGEMYNEDLIEKTKDRLMASGIFSSVDIKINKPVLDNKKQHMAHSEVVITVEEAKLRDISVGASFGTTEKLGALFSWTHYNVDGKGAKFSTITSLSKKLQTQRLKYTVPDLFYKRQELKNQVFASKENVTAYNIKKIGAESILWQEVAHNVNLGLGLCSEISKTKDKVLNSQYERFKAVGIPFGLMVDTTNVFLDPQSGFRCFAMTVPYLCKKQFTSLNIKGSFYIPLSKSKYNNTIVMACYSRFGSMITSKTKAIPRDKLFFGGGANSVRGYGYQLLGEVNDDRKPLGGESVFEVGIEPRVKISDNVGLVAFIEGGNVYHTRMPKLSKRLMYGGGFGVRYYTPLGPIRLDIAFPFKRRKTVAGKSIDSICNIYISIGQAF